MACGARTSIPERVSAGHGQLSNDSTTDSLVPVYVIGLASGVSGVSAGDHHTCAVTSAGTIKCWAQNAHGELGNNPAGSSPVPVEVTGF